MNEYGGSGFARLDYARRDAEALRSLFLDSYRTEVEPALLLDRDATRERIVEELRKLGRSVGRADTAVIAFSGHGTPDGYLLPQDAVPDRLSTTALSADDLVDLVNQINAKLTVVILDCCFSGKAATKSVLPSAAAPTARDGAVATQTVLQALENSTRVVLTACGPHQKARESAPHGHGLLTYYLLRAFLDEPSIVEADGHISSYQLYDYLSSRVSSHYGELLQQDPGTSHSGGRVLLGPFRRGPRLARFPDHKPPEAVSKPFRTLRPHGILAGITDLWEEQVGVLNRMQIDVLNKTGLLRGKNVLVPAPTSSGKTLLGEIAALRSHAEGKPSVFLVPTRALASDHAAAFRERYRSFGFRVVVATGEIRDQTGRLLAADFDLAVCTYEKFLGIVNAEPELLSRIGVLVVDEIQHLGQPGRGGALELLLTTVGLNRASATMPQVVGLSATLTNPGPLAGWLGADLAEIPEPRREPPLLEGVIAAGGRYRHVDADGTETTVALIDPVDPIDDEETGPPLTGNDRVVYQLVKKLLADGDQVMIFKDRLHEARALADGLARRLKLPQATAALAALPDGDDTRLRELLRTCLEKGVAFHTAELDRTEREAVENAFGRTGEVRVIVCTQTLAQGVNLPAASVIVDPGDRTVPVEVYKNMVGRAGRTGRAPLGRSFLVLEDEAREHTVWRSHVRGHPAELASQLFARPTGLSPVVLAALSDAVRWYDRRAGVEEFFAASFAAHRARFDFTSDARVTSAEVRAAIADLRASGLVRDNGPRLQLTPLGEIACRSGLGVDVVVATARALREVPAGSLNAATLICSLHLASQKGDLSLPPDFGEQDRIATWLQEQGVEPTMVDALRQGDRKVGVLRLLMTQVCIRWANGMTSMSIENAVPSLLGSRRRPYRTPGHQHARRPVVPVSRIVGEAADRVEVVLDIAREVMPVTELGTLARTLPVRLEFGVPEDQVDVARQVGAAIDRSGYQRLHLNGIRTPDDVLSTSDTRLLECLSHDHDLVRTVREGAARALEEAQAEGADSMGR
ncbi:DEAD/DEAH box helicase [Actinocorallia sp. A-T 12471]|uniref:DEAD/DEAH box helicase n=1 Tax=Actinocorallia sp. A-T 12471 TaxID=3089813 RepID=UPI0029D3BECC|nr:DEAD/DEAH box helicase [Actinocorallia sp. A-T 12471]MDX6740423.1 DEAD/DEAH box helicase [Actinocorallia sp. A-T 12471]